MKGLLREEQDRYKEDIEMLRDELENEVTFKCEIESEKKEPSIKDIRALSQKLEKEFKNLDNPALNNNSVEF